MILYSDPPILSVFLPLHPLYPFTGVCNSSHYLDSSLSGHPECIPRPHPRSSVTPLPTRLHGLLLLSPRRGTFLPRLTGSKHVTWWVPRRTDLTSPNNPVLDPVWTPQTRNTTPEPLGDTVDSTPVSPQT